MKKNSQRGFTLIELLVVIAIIGILASVVLASLNTARSKGADANIKSNLANARAQAELYYDSKGSYFVSTTDNVCVVAAASNGIQDLIVAAAKTAGISTVGFNTVSSQTTATCHASLAGWAAAVPLKADTTHVYCVDSNGSSRPITSAGLAATSVACPAS